MKVKTIKKIGIIGLGLLGGSFAKAIKTKTSHLVYGCDSNKQVIEKAFAAKAIDRELSEKNMKECDVLIVALFPGDIVNWMKTNIRFMKKRTIVFDIAGVKQNICHALSAFCSEKEIFFIGGHPMAGTEKKGFDYSSPHMFENASMIFCKDKYTNEAMLEQAGKLCKELGFYIIKITTAEEHDRMIAYTSHLAHIISSAYIRRNKSAQKDFSAGSYKDMTRIAALDENLWTELFFENRVFLTAELQDLTGRLTQYKQALDSGNYEQMKKLLIEGKNIKMEENMFAEKKQQYFRS